MQNSGRSARGRPAQIYKEREREFLPSLGFLILECHRNLIEDYEADFLAFDVARSEGAIFDVSNFHFYYLSFSFFL